VAAVLKVPTPLIKKIMVVAMAIITIQLYVHNHGQKLNIKIPVIYDVEFHRLLRHKNDLFTNSDHRVPQQKTLSIL
jgi:hypothetical protein